MPNLCDYEMKIKGSKKAISRVVACLQANYNYGVRKPSHKHFFRVFNAYDDEPMVDNGDGTFTKYIFGDVAWSVYSCMCSGEHTYYNDLKKSHPDIFMGTTLAEQSRDCEIEVFPEEGGMGFSEHYLFLNGKCIIDEETDLESAGYDEKGNITTKLDFDEYDGDIVFLNTFRRNETEEFRWKI